MARINNQDRYSTRITIDGSSSRYSPESGLPEIRFLGEPINPNRIFAYILASEAVGEHSRNGGTDYTGGKSWRRLRLSLSTAVIRGILYKLVNSFDFHTPGINHIESL